MQYEVMLWAIAERFFQQNILAGLNKLVSCPKIISWLTDLWIYSHNTLKIRF
jgi:hypothetical protein